jgi:hypothetical protein
LEDWHPLRWLRELHHAEIPVEEYVEAGSLVVRAEIPGIDPDTDVALTLADDRMRIRVDRRARHRTDDQRRVVGVLGSVSGCTELERQAFGAGVPPADDPVRVDPDHRLRRVGRLRAAADLDAARSPRRWRR